MEEILKAIILGLEWLYKILNFCMPFMIWYIYNKIDKIDDKIERR